MWRTAPSVGLAVFLVGCGSGTAPDDPPALTNKVLSIVLSPNALAVAEKGAAAQLSAVIKTENGAAATATVVWTSSAPTIAAVSGSGTSATVTPLAPGTAIVTATASGVSGQATVTVTPSAKKLTVTRVGDGTVSSSPAGLTCNGTTCSGEFPGGASVALTAIPSPGNRMSGWTGACTGAGLCTVTMSAERAVTVTFESKVAANGFTPEINAFLSDTLLAAMATMGVPVFRGATPPSIEGTFRMSPAKLLASTVPGDPIGATTNPILERFRQQDNEHLTVVSDYRGSNEEGRGIAGFVVGTDSSFTVFGRFKTVALGDTADNVEVISGHMRADGIADLHFVGFVLDNRGNPHGYFIPNNTGRHWYDADGFSERTADLDSLAVKVKRAVANAAPRADSTSGPLPAGLFARKFD